MKSTPESIPFTMKVSREGDIFSSVEFTLRSTLPDTTTVNAAEEAEPVATKTETRAKVPVNAKEGAPLDKGQQAKAGPTDKKVDSLVKKGNVLQLGKVTDSAKKGVTKLTGARDNKLPKKEQVRLADSLRKVTIKRKLFVADSMKQVASALKKQQLRKEDSTRQPIRELKKMALLDTARARRKESGGSKLPKSDSVSIASSRRIKDSTSFALQLKAPDSAKHVAMHPADSAHHLSETIGLDQMAGSDSLGIGRYETRTLFRPSDTVVGNYSILIDVFNNEKSAYRAAARLDRIFRRPVGINQKYGDYMVLLKGFMSFREARNMLPALGRAGYRDALVIKAR